MAAATFSVTAVTLDAFQAVDPAQQQAAANVTPVNANQAQGAPAPADTVTLTNQAAEGQQTGADPDHGRFDRAAFLGAVAAYAGTRAADANRQPPEPTLPALLPQAQTQDPPAATADTAPNQTAGTAPNTSANTGVAIAAANAPNANAAASTANAAANTANPANADATAGESATTPQQQLQQLDQSLQQLGINPQSIPLFNRMAMLLYASDPAALRLLVQTMQGAATQQTSAQTTNPTGTASQAAAQGLLPAATADNQGQTTAQQAAAAPAAAQTQAPPPQTQPQSANAAEQIDVIAAQFNFTEVQATIQPAQTAPTQASMAAAPANTAANTQSAQPSPFTVQIEELQVAFQAVEIQQGPLQLSGSSGPTPTGGSLNVTV